MSDHGRPTPTASGGMAYIPALDGLRAIGVGLVLAHHALTPHPMGGYLGVDIFFVLSGYLITTLLVIEFERTSTIALTGFFLRRAIRLYPALLTALVLCALPGMVLTWSPKQFGAETLFAALYLTPITVPLTHIGWAWLHTWSLGIEEMFYLLWPPLLRPALRRGTRSDRVCLRLAVAGVALLVAQLAVTQVTGEMITFLRASGILLGCAAAIWLRRRPHLRVGPGPAWGSLLLLVVAVVVGNDYRFEAVAVALSTIASLGLIAHLATGGRSLLARALALRPVVYTGQISYELYLWHYPLLVFAATATGSTFVDVWWMVAAPTLVLSAVTHRLWRGPQERMKARLGRNPAWRRPWMPEPFRPR